MNSLYSIDLHIHSKEGSRCSSLALSEIFSKLNGSHLNFIAITDHGSTAAYDKLKEINHSIKVLPGMEVSTTEGHFGIYTLNGEKLKNLPPYFQTVEELPDDPDFFIVWLHPRSPSDRGWGPPTLEMVERVRRHIHAIEVLNGKMLDLMLQEMVEPEYLETLLFIADRYDLVKTAGSDAHNLSQLNVCWTNIKAKSESPEDILQALKNGETSLQANPEIFRKLGSLIK